MFEVVDTLGLTHSIATYQVLWVEEISGDGCIIHMNGGTDVTTDTSRAAVVEAIRLAGTFYLPQTPEVMS